METIKKLDILKNHFGNDEEVARYLGITLRYMYYMRDGRIPGKSLKKLIEITSKSIEQITH